MGADCVTPGKNVHTFNFVHDNASYVNLEQLQAHGLLRHDVPICSGPDKFHKSMLNLYFNDHGSYSRAKQHWQVRDDLFFVIEDASCVEGEGARSVYSYVHARLMQSSN
jgi:hypothetical protein